MEPKGAAGGRLKFIRNSTSHLTKDCDHLYTYSTGPKSGGKSSLTQRSLQKGLRTNPANRGASSGSSIETPAFPFVYEPILPNVCQVVEVSTSTPSPFAKNLKSTKNSREEGEGLVSSKKSVSSQQRLRPENRTQKSTFQSQADANDEERRKQWEQNYALECIRDLRQERADGGRDDEEEEEQQDSKKRAAPCLTSSVFRCRICSSERTFVSVNSLLYHYRSHAGIKPYECSICEATFTRQHSLNYHMLIHLNKTRFVCEECGRHFRHPSHFKEHMRRHTGETPFQCMECTLKFKTRNTYKRHLQTKHGKILTAKGIYEAPNADNQPKKPCAPRRKYGLGYLHQNIEAIAQYEEAQKEYEKRDSESNSRSEPITSNASPFNFVASNDNFEQLLQAAALAAYDERILLEDRTFIREKSSESDIKRTVST